MTVTRPMRPCHAGKYAKGYVMKKWKALLAGAFAGALIASFALVGCSSSNDGDQMSSSDEGSTADMAAKADPVELHVFAANSLQKALPEVQELYTKAHPEVSFADTQFEASGTLVSKLAGTDGQTQAHADIFIAASTSSMDKADKNGSIDASTRLNITIWSSPPPRTAISRSPTWPISEPTPSIPSPSASPMRFRPASMRCSPSSPPAWQRRPKRMTARCPTSGTHRSPTR